MIHQIKKRCDIDLGLDVHSEVWINGAERILVASQIHPIQLWNGYHII